MKKLILFIFLISSFTIKLNAFDSVDEWKAIDNIVLKTDVKIGSLNVLQKKQLIASIDFIIKNYKQDIQKNETDNFNYINSPEFAAKIVKLKGLKQELESDSSLNYVFEESLLGPLKNQINLYIQSQDIIEIDTSNCARVPHVKVQNDASSSGANTFSELQRQLIEAKAEIILLNTEKQALKAALSTVLVYNIARFGYNTLQANPKLAFVVKAAAFASAITGGYKYAQKKKWLG